MVVPGITGPLAAAPGRRRPAPGGAFAVPGSEPSAPETNVPAHVPGGVIALPGLLEMQEAAAGGPGAGMVAADRPARQHADALLQALGAVQAGLLTGLGGAAAARLAALAGGGPHAADPRLAAVLGAVRLRAEVELARTALRRESDTENPSSPNS